MLDVQLADETTFALADALAERGIPHVFWTAHSEIDFPQLVRQKVLTKLAHWSALIAFIERLVAVPRTRTH